MDDAAAYPTSFGLGSRPIFSKGDLGAAHLLVHGCLERGRLELGRRTLGPWLDARLGAGSEWVHLHWHQLVFELGCDDWTRARRRFSQHILPAVDLGLALTDAPQALWRLALHSSASGELPWEPVANTAERYLGHADPTVELHNLLALAGAGELGALRRWSRRFPSAHPDLRVAADALSAYVDGDFQDAASRMGQLEAAASPLGGSRAQAELLDLIRLDANERRYRAA